MAIVRDRGPGDLMITMTCNPKWPEITKHLLPNQTAADRMDLVIKAFKLKLDALKSSIWEGRGFGRSVAYLHVIEFQKRGLPHAHIIVWLHKNDKLNTPEKIDSFISAELPDPTYEPEIFDLVIDHMVHGPCGDFNPKLRCMKHVKLTGRKVCKNHFPKKYVDKTVISDNGLVTYRRRNIPSRTATIRRQQIQEDGRMKWVDFEVTSQHIVPYNKGLLMEFKCHINVEVCTGVRMIKYLHKYVYKGPDRAHLRGIKVHKAAQRQAAPNQRPAVPPPAHGPQGIGHPLPAAAGGAPPLPVPDADDWQADVDDMGEYLSARYV